MSRTFLLGGAAALMLTGLAGAANAQTQSPRTAERAQPVAQADFVQRRVERLQTLDANNDGVVTAEERRAAMQTRRAERTAQAFDRLDANRDGVLSREEFLNRPERARAERAGPRGKRLNRRVERRMDQPVRIEDARTRATEQFSRMDADNDGVVTAQERRAFMQQMREQRRERRAARPASPAAPASE